MTGLSALATFSPTTAEWLTFTLMLSTVVRVSSPDAVSSISIRPLNDRSKSKALWITQTACSSVLTILASKGRMLALDLRSGIGGRK